MADNRPVLQREKNSKKSINDLQVPNWVAIPILLVILAVGGGLFWYSQRGPGNAALAGTQFASSAASGADVVEVLPQPMRGYNPSANTNPFGGESISSIQVTGIISNSLGTSTVILEMDGASFIVSEGQALPDSEWIVRSVSTNSVTFGLDGNEKTVFIEGTTPEEQSASTSSEESARDAEETPPLREPEETSSALSSAPANPALSSTPASSAGSKTQSMSSAEED